MNWLRFFRNEFLGWTPLPYGQGSEGWPSGRGMGANAAARMATARAQPASLQNPDRKGGVLVSSEIAGEDLTGSSTSMAMSLSAPVFLITFACYGSWLPGEPGAVSRRQNQFGSPLIAPGEPREFKADGLAVQEPYLLDAVRRRAALESVEQVCRFRGWMLLAAHVRTNHVHVVVMAETKPETVMNALKAYSSGALNDLKSDYPGRRRWARHGSTRYLWTRDSVANAIRYVVEEQGDAMAVFQSTDTPPLRSGF